MIDAAGSRVSKLTSSSLFPIPMLLACKGLAIEPAWDWSKTYPVLKLDMGSCQAASVKDLWRKIDTMLKAESERLGVPLRTDEPSSGECCECPSRSDGPPVGTGIEAIVVLTGGPSLRDGRHPQGYRPVG